jgi:zinc transport system substrate-binding protein
MLSVQPAPTLTLAAWFVLALWSTAPSWAKEPAAALPVAVSVPPVRTMVDRVGGIHVQAQSVVPPSEDPEGFTPAPDRVAGLAGARLYIGTGAPFESAWIEPMRRVNPRLRIVDATAGVAPNRQHGGAEPGYVWTSPPLAKQIAWRIRDALIEADPARARVYRRRTERLNEEFDTLDRDLRTVLAPVTLRRFMMFPPTWGPFAATYGLVQIPVDPAGLGAGPQAALSLIGQARREGVRVIMLPRGLDSRAARQFAWGSKAEIYTFDPLAADIFQVSRGLAGLIADAELR